MPAENFADKWALYPKRRDAFFSWMQRARRELIDEPLQSLGIDQLKKHYSAVLGEAPVTRAIKALGAETRIKSEKTHYIQRVLWADYQAQLQLETSR